MTKQDKCNYCKHKPNGVWQGECFNCIRNGVKRKDNFINNGFPIDSMKFDRKGNLVGWG